MNKKIVCAKDIIIWVAAVFFFIAAILGIAYTPNVISRYMEYAGSGTYTAKEMTFAVNKFTSNEIAWTRLPWVSDLPATAFSARNAGDPTLPKTLLIEGTPLYLIGIIFMFVASFGLVGFTFLKPSKGRTWGFILSFIIGLTGSIVFTVGDAIFSNNVVMSIYKNSFLIFKDGDATGTKVDDVPSYWSSYETILYNGKQYAKYIKQNNGATAYLSRGNSNGGAGAMALPYFGFVIALVGTCIRSPKVARGIVEEAPAEEAKVEEAPVVEEVVPTEQVEVEGKPTSKPKKKK